MDGWGFGIGCGMECKVLYWECNMYEGGRYCFDADIFKSITMYSAFSICREVIREQTLERGIFLVRGVYTCAKHYSQLASSSPSAQERASSNRKYAPR